jgi:hypothetical protein
MQVIDTVVPLHFLSHPVAVAVFDWCLRCEPFAGVSCCLLVDVVMVQSHVAVAMHTSKWNKAMALVQSTLV